MGAFFSSLNRTIIAGVVLVIVVILLAGAYTGNWIQIGKEGWWMFAMRWLHVTAGVMWIGLLWYFNFVQTPSMPKIPDEQKPAVSKVIAPAALFWFRWAAMATIILGLILAGMNGYLGKALGLQKEYFAIGLGMWLGAIMWFNVWFIIWPNQKKALGIVPAEDAAKAKAASLAMMASRTNLILSLPMLYCMVMQKYMG
jgi:uncharacterized membrane protein